MTENIARQPVGILAGGQFAATAHSESGITLDKPRSYDPEQVAKGMLGAHQALGAAGGAKSVWYWYRADTAPAPERYGADTGLPPALLTP